MEWTSMKSPTVPQFIRARAFSKHAQQLQLSWQEKDNNNAEAIVDLAEWYERGAISEDVFSSSVNSIQTTGLANKIMPRHRHLVSRSQREELVSMAKQIFVDGDIDQERLCYIVECIESSHTHARLRELGITDCTRLGLLGAISLSNH